MKKFIFLTSILFSSLQLFSQQHLDLKSNQNLRKIFSLEEIGELEKIIYYVDSILLIKSESTDIYQAYHEFLDETYVSLIDSAKSVAFNEKKKYLFLTSLPNNIFNAIWRWDTNPQFVRYKDTALKNLDNFKLLSFNPHGRYMEYLRLVGETNEFYNNLQTSIHRMGGLPASTAVWYTKNNDKFDFSTVEDRLWAAIFILSKEETTQEKVERYLN